MTAPTLNGLRVVSARLLHPWRGAWVADLDLDPDAVSQAPTSGSATLVMGGSTLTGTVDPRGSGSFGPKGLVRVVAGAGGWDKPVGAKHWHADNGVRSGDVYQGTAGLVGETVQEAAPSSLGIDYVRTAGPASRVLDAVDWYVDLAGITQVGARPAAAADATLELIDWDPVQKRAELTCDALVLPGTVLSDPRLNGQTPTVRDVEQVFDASGSHVKAWCASQPVARLAAALKNMVREFGRTAYLRAYPYRIVQENSDGRLQLQAIRKSDGVPDTLPLTVWSGVQGASTKVQTAALCLVHFVDGDPTQPVVIGFAPAVPLEATYDAEVAVHVGPSALRVELAGGANPLVPAPWATGIAEALFALGTSLAGFTTGPLAPLGAVGRNLLNALAQLPAPATTKTTAT